MTMDERRAGRGAGVHNHPTLVTVGRGCVKQGASTSDNQAAGGRAHASKRERDDTQSVAHRMEVVFMK